MAREIHDSLAQGLAGIITELKPLSRPGCRAHGGGLGRPGHRRPRGGLGAADSDAARLARESLAEARRSVRAGAPRHWGTPSCEALTEVAKRSSAETASAPRHHHRERAGPAPPGRGHAAARRAGGARQRGQAANGRGRDTVSYMDDVVTLDVRDDGVGFRLPPPKDRAAAGSGWPRCGSGSRLAGQLAIESDPAAEQRSRPGARHRPGTAGETVQPHHPSPASPATEPAGPSGGGAHGAAAGGRGVRCLRRMPATWPGRIRLLIATIARSCGRPARILERSPDFEVVGEAANGAQAVTRARALRPGHGADGSSDARHRRVTTIERLAERAPTARVLVLTTYDTDAEWCPRSRPGHRLPVQGRAAHDLLRAVRAAANGEAVLSPSVATRLLGQDAGKDGARKRAGPEPLSGRELDVLSLIAHGCSNRDTAVRLFISEATVKDPSAAHLRQARRQRPRGRRGGSL